MRTLLPLIVLVTALVARGNPVVADWVNPPFCMVAEHVDLIVGRDVTVVSGKYMFQYVEEDDPTHTSRVFIHYPLYVASGERSLDQIVNASRIVLKFNGHVFTPKDGGPIKPGYISDFPVPEDASVAFVTFDIPRKLAQLRFEVEISHVQPNFHYQGSVLAAYTPWLPKYKILQRSIGIKNEDFVVSFAAAETIKFKRYTANADPLSSSDTELSERPVHRKTIAVEIQPIHDGLSAAK